MSGALCCIIGWPVQQSLSPAIHNAAFAATGIDWTYIPLAVGPDAAEAGVALLRALDVVGANVTMPHKQSVIPYLDALEADADAVGAVNTIIRRDGRLIGDNTDGAGFIASLRSDAGFAPAGRHALVLGAGGSARAVALALVRAGARVRVAARRIEQAHEIAALAEGIGAVEWGKPVQADLLVNATPARAGLPLDRLPLGPDLLTVDLIYQPPETELILAAREAGGTAFGGLGMLVHQAALSFERWTGVEAPIDVMRAAADDAMARLSISGR